MVEKSEELYVDEPCVFTFFCGEIGWFLQKTQGYLRYLMQEDSDFIGRKLILMMNIEFHPFVADFVSYTIDLPREFYNLNLETDCYEAPLPGSPGGSLTPPNVYKALIEYGRQFYNKDKAIELRLPRGCDTWVDTKPQKFRRYESTLNIETPENREIICVFPRGRSRAPQRNIPEYIWYEVVEELRKRYFIVLGGTIGGSFLSSYSAENVVNLIPYSGEDKIERIIACLNNSLLSVSSQSGPTHISLLCNTPSYIIGHERVRHSITENRLKTPCSFRELQDYRLIDPQTIVNDVESFAISLRATKLSSEGIDSVVGSDKEELESILDG